MKYTMERTVYMGSNTSKVYVPRWVCKALGLKNKSKIKVTFEGMK